tara:strand:+ start:1802 stop:5266 length:3465 start_codon:yes stop_codon:yes gene_type:complete
MARAGVTLREIDLSTKGSAQKLQPSGTPAGVIGTAKKGPAYVPHVFANMEQFADKFGSVTEVGLDSNGHRFGPLAINEWMQNSQAGAFVRLLGTGDGKKAGSGGRVTNAGFVVGSQQVQTSGKVGESSNIISPAGTFTGGRTYMLGCYMSESNGSRYLSEAGLQRASDRIPAFSSFAAKAGSQVKITWNDLDSTVGNGKTIKLLVEAPGVYGANTFNVSIDETDADVRIVWRLNSTTAALGTLAQLVEVINNGTLEAASAGLTLTDASNLRGKIKASLVSGDGSPLLVDGDDETITLSNGSELAVPIIRGVLFAANGVYPGLNIQDSSTNKLDNNSFIAAGGVNEKAASTAVNSGATGSFGNATSREGDLGYNFGAVNSTQDFEIYLNGLNNSDYSTLVKCSFDPNKTNYFAKVLNTDPTKLEEAGHYLYAHWDVTGSAIPSNHGLGLSGVNKNDDMVGFLLSGSAGRATSTDKIPDYETLSDRYKTAKSPYVISQIFDNNTSDRSDIAPDSIYNLFRLHALDDGEIGHKQFRVLIENILAADNSDSYGQFDLVLESLESDPIKGDKLAVFRNLTFDPDSKNYIARVIGDRHMFYDFDRDESSQRLEERGQFEVRNPFVRVELSEELARHDGSVPKKAIPAGFRGLGHLYTKGAEADAIFSDDLDFWNGAKHFLSASIPPVPMVRSLGRFVDSTTTEPDKIPWGVKFGLRQVADTSLKEATEVTIDRSLHSFLKFFSLSTDSAGKKAMYVEQDDAFCNNLFSLEKISLKSLTNNRIDNWGDAVYKRDGIKETSHNRFLAMETDAKTYNMKYMRFRFPMLGGFDGLNIFDKEKTELTNVAAIRENNNETGASPSIFTGPTIAAYQKGIDVFSDKSATEIQLLVTPGLSAAKVTDYGIAACEDRFDAMYIMDIERYSKDNVISGSANTFENKVNVSETTSKFESRGLDTSFAAAYFPNVIMRRPIDNAPVKVPASVGVLGVYAQNDSIADPWFAPAGLERGQIQRAIGSDVYLREDELDEIYDVDINPIYVPAGRSEETYIFGQKTLLQDPSALDRVNVRRLLINLRRQVKKVAEKLLFEPNRESTLERFTALVEPIMQRVQQRRGVVRYKVQIDTSTTTDIDIENNTLRGRIFLQPTKSVEFISLDFVVTNTISE